jgi:hypothetical protein
MKNSKKLLFLFIFPVLCIAIISSVRQISYAEDKQGIIVSPPTFFTSVDAGKTLTQDFNVTNQRSQAENFTVQTREVGIDENGEFFVPEGYETDQTSTLERNGWITISEKNFILNVNESKLVTVTITMPTNMNTNGYYLELAFTTQPISSTSKVSITPEVVIPLAINYHGGTQSVRKIGIFEFKQAGKPDEVSKGGITKSVEGFIKLLTFDSKSQISQYLPIKFTSRITNVGNTNMVPAGQIFIATDPDFKNIITTSDFNGTNLMVFAGKNRTFENSWNDGFIEQDANGKTIYHWDQLNKIRIGKYYAQLTVAWEGDAGVDFTSNVITFWVIPWKELTATTLAGTSIFGGIVWVIKKNVTELIAKRTIAAA